MRRGRTLYQSWSRTPLGAFLLTLASSLLAWIVLIIAFGPTDGWLLKALAIGGGIGAVQAFKASRGEERKPTAMQARTGWILMAIGIGLFAIVAIISLVQH